MEHEGLLLFDGAFGTYYSEQYGDDDYIERANRQHPERVLAIHSAYLAAGARAIKTNTFGLSPILYPDEAELRALLKAGYQLAQQAAEPYGAKVFADIGCAAEQLEPEEAKRAYLTVSEQFLQLGARCFLFETMHTLSALLPALSHIRAAAPDAFVIVSFAVSQDGYTQAGESYQRLISDALLAGADAAGLNCVCGPGHIARLLGALDIPKGRLCAMPNAGYPSSENGRTVYRSNAAYFSEKLGEIMDMGVRIVGGCCGTTPEHIRAVAMRAEQAPSREKPAAVPASDTKRTAAPNRFLDALKRKKKVAAVEIDPPADTDCSYLMEASRQVAAAGADIVTIADSPLAKTRADSIMMAARVLREVGVPVLPHISCRDKNHIGLKASLLCASMEGIRNVLVITGDPIPQSDRLRNRGVFCFQSLRLISYIDSLNHDVFAHAPFFIGAALNVNAPRFEHELARALEKQRCGARMFLTQPVCSQAALENLALARRQLQGAWILCGILPFASYKNALFLNNEVSGITIPEHVLKACEGKDAEAVRQLSVSFMRTSPPARRAG